MATIYTRATKGSALTWTEGDANITNLNTDKIESVVEDITPQLGGNLDVNGNKIVSVSNGNIVIEPDGTGDVQLVTDTLQVGDGDANATITTNGTGDLELTTDRGSNSGLIKITAGVDGDIEITPNGVGAIVLDGLNWPQADGTTGQFLTTDGEGNLGWADGGGSSGTLAIEDGGTGATTALDAWRNLQTYEAFNIGVALTNESAYVQNAYGSGGIGVTLPETATMAFATGFLITNTSSEVIFVKTYTDVEVTVLEPGRAMEITVTNTSSDAADSWQFYKQGFNNVVQDTAPQLGGNLNLNGYDINGEYVPINGTANIQLSVNNPEFGSSSLSIGPTSIQLSSPTGSINLDGANWPKLSYTDPLTGVVTAIDDEADPNTLTLDNYTGINVNDPIVFSGTEVTSIGLTENVTYYISADLGSGTYELAEYPSGPNIVLTDIGTITDVNYTVTITISNVSGGEVLTYQSGTLSWQAPSGITNVVDDTTPQLGGNLDVNDNSIVSSSDGNIVIAPNGTGKSVVNNINYNETPYSLGTTSGTVAPNVANGNVQTITLDGNLTLNAFTDPIAGQSLTLIIDTNGTSRTLTSSMKFAGGIKIISVVDTIDIISIFYDGTNYWASLSKDFK